MLWNNLFNIHLFWDWNSQCERRRSVISIGSPWNIHNISNHFSVRLASRIIFIMKLNQFVYKYFVQKRECHAIRFGDPIVNASETRILNRKMTEWRIFYFYLHLNGRKHFYFWHQARMPTLNRGSTINHEIHTSFFVLDMFILIFMGYFCSYRVHFPLRDSK